MAFNRIGMNLYFLVEGEKTEIKLYPKWMSYLLPEFKQVFFLKDVDANSYYVISGFGIPSINDHTVNAIKDINAKPIFDYLIVCLDGDEIGVAKRKEKLFTFIRESGIILNSKCTLKVIVQNVCIETWFLGNRKVFKQTPTSENLRNFISHYNVKLNDPEQMDNFVGFPNKAHFHIRYLKEMFAERNMRYSKSNPKEVCEESYLRQLLERTQKTTHLSSLADFFNVVFEIRTKLSPLMSEDGDHLNS